MKRYLKEFEKLVLIMRRLRGAKGCMWDKEQTHESLIKHLFSESEELKAAVSKNDMENIQEELGDILLQVVFHSQIAKEKKTFDITDVIKTLNQKLIRRHPHIFGGYKVKNTEDIVEMWNKIKQQEKADKLKRKIKRQ
jgi:tetrapyrrole methylase family protein/MazG family protein